MNNNLILIRNTLYILADANKVEIKELNLNKEARDTMKKIHIILNRFDETEKLHSFIRNDIKKLKDTYNNAKIYIHIYKAYYDDIKYYISTFENTFDIKFMCHANKKYSFLFYNGYRYYIVSMNSKGYLVKTIDNTTIKNVSDLNKFIGCDIYVDTISTFEVIYTSLGYDFIDRIIPVKVRMDILYNSIDSNLIKILGNKNINYNYYGVITRLGPIKIKKIFNDLKYGLYTTLRGGA